MGGHPGLAPNGSTYILEVGLFVGSDCGDFLLNSFMDRLGSWRSVFLSNQIMEISCQIVSWIPLCLGGWSFCWIESCRFSVRLLPLLPSVFWVGQIMDLFCCVMLQHTLLFLGVVLFVMVWRDFLQRPIELGRCGLDVLCGGPQRPPFCLISRIFSQIGS